MAGIIEVKDQGKLRIYDADNSNYIDIVVPSTVSSNRTITLPDASFTVPQADTTGLTGVSTDSGNVTITDGNLTFGGAGHGVHLGVTSATAANLLDDYEEGSWTPGNPNISLTEAYGRYTKIGNLVTIIGFVVIPNTSDSNQFFVTSLPFTSGNTDANVQGNISLANIGTDNAYIVCQKNTTQMRMVDNSNNAITNSAVSGDFISFSASYNV